MKVPYPAPYKRASSKVRRTSDMWFFYFLGFAIIIALQKGTVASYPGVDLEGRGLRRQHTVYDFQELRRKIAEEESKGFSGRPRPLTRQKAVDDLPQLFRKFEEENEVQMNSTSL
ncbi:hypothetical protein GCK32_002109 [Trichostrongylus colubriformis]|uniref:Uncharacterized protein n=1 Tax=Trichostrongylus colubriformis TaxID=6319 RepID=A0AAN8F991_TRICO